MYPLKKSTAITVPFFVHDVNGDAITGLVDAGFTKRISKNGGAFAAMTVTITEMENGWYSFPLSTSHSDTVGILTIVFKHASAKQVNLQYRVHDRLPDDLAYPTVAGRSIDVTATGAVGIDWANVEGQATSVDLSATTINLVNTTTTNTDMRGTDNALLASNAPTNFSDLAITAASGQVTVGTNNDKTGYSVANGGITASAFASGAINDAALANDVINKIFQGSTLTESYAADGAAATPAQLLYMLLSAIAEFSISGTTITTKKLDGTTTAMTYTLDDATNPTSRTRAT